MKVTVEVNDMKFLVPVGDGGQSLKWLAMVAAQRYVRVGVGHMRLSSANRFVRLMMHSISLTSNNRTPRVHNRCRTITILVTGQAAWKGEIP